MCGLWVVIKHSGGSWRCVCGGGVGGTYPALYILNFSLSPTNKVYSGACRSAFWEDMMTERYPNSLFF